MLTRLPSLAAGLLLLLVVACGESRSAANPTPRPQAVTVTLTAGGCELGGPTQLHVGVLVVHARNQTSDSVWLGLAPITGGHTYAEFVTWVDRDRASQLAGRGTIGPPDWASPTSFMSAPQHGPVDLQWSVGAGIYAFACGRHGTNADGSGRELGLWAAGPLLVT